MNSRSMVDVAGRRRSPVTLPGYHAARAPRNKGLRYPPDPPRVEEIVAVMCQAGDGAHGDRLRGLIVVRWRAGLRIAEALALGEADLDEHRGALLVRNGKGGQRREVGMDDWAGSTCELGSSGEPHSRSAGCSASSTARPADVRGRPERCAHNCAGSPFKQACGVASRRTSSATPTPSSWRARASR
jgi:integrase